MPLRWSGRFLRGSVLTRSPEGPIGQETGAADRYVLPMATRDPALGNECHGIPDGDADRHTLPKFGESRTGSRMLTTRSGFLALTSFESFDNGQTMIAIRRPLYRRDIKNARPRWVFGILPFQVRKGIPCSKLLIASSSPPEGRYDPEEDGVAFEKGFSQSLLIAGIEFLAGAGASDCSAKGSCDYGWKSIIEPHHRRGSGPDYFAHPPIVSIHYPSVRRNSVGDQGAEFFFGTFHPVFQPIQCIEFNVRMPESRRKPFSLMSRFERKAQSESCCR